MFETSSFHLCNFEVGLGSKIGFAHETHRPKFQITHCKATLVHPS